MKSTASKALNHKFGLVVVALMLIAGIFTLEGSTISQAINLHPEQEELEIVAGHQVAAHRVIVKYRTSKSRAAMQSIAQALDVDTDVELGGTGARLLH